jgi:hypothetical protein
VVVSGPEHGNLSGSAPDLTYTPATNYFGLDSMTFRANDGSLTSALATVSITLTNVNDAPVLPVWATVTVDELTLLTVTNTATDPDSGSAYLVYNLTATNFLDGGVVTNALIDTNGMIFWTPTEAQGPGTNCFTTVVSDGSLSATNAFLVVVAEVNSAPVLPAPGDRAIDVLTVLTVTNTAADSDWPVNVLSYDLAAGPAGAQIGADGVITWTPLSGQGDSTNLFMTVVTDDGLPPQSNTNTFLVRVNAAPVIPPPVITSVNVTGGDIILTWESVPPGIYRVQYTDELGSTNWTDVLPELQATGSVLTATNPVGSAPHRFYRLRVVPLP